MYILTMDGYGVKIEEITSLLKEDVREEFINHKDIFTTFEDLIEEENMITCFVCEDGHYLYIPNQPPYEPLFFGKDQIDKYFFDNIKSYLKEDCSFEEFRKYLDDKFGCEQY